jgi:beta-lactamase regulating signal transducer with metallopeptidase domain
MTHLDNLLLLIGFKATLILGVVATLLLLAGRRWPHACTLWQRLGVTALLALPIAVAALPAIAIPVLATVTPAASGDDALHPFQNVAEVPFTVSGEAATHSLPAGGRDLSNAALPSLSVPGSAESATSRHSILNIFRFGIVLVYSFVVIALAIRFVGACLGLSRLKRASSLVNDSAWHAGLEYWSRALGVRRPVELRSSDDISVPMTFGWRLPVVLVPQDCLASFDGPQRDAILIHELTHVARGDFFWQALTQLTASLYWAHPLMWLIRRLDGSLRERICDALCSQHLSRQSYAEALVRIAGRNVLKPVGALGMAMAHRSSLRRRLEDLETCTPAHSSAPNRAKQALLGATAGIVLGLIVVGALTSRASAQIDSEQGTKTTAATKPSPPSAKTPVSQTNPVKTVPVAPVRLPGTIEGKVLDRQNNPVANANVIVRIDRYGTFLDPASGAAPGPWTASTDDQGRFTISTGEPPLGPDDVLGIKIRADGFADVSTFDYERQALKDSLPVQQLHAGRIVQGGIVDPEGNPLADAVLRFQANSADMSLLWDSGPLPIDQRSEFSVSIPKDAKAAVVIYPRGFAPRIVDIPADGADLGSIRVETGTSLTGRVVNLEGRGVARTVVAIRSAEYALLFGFGVPIGTAVITDADGRFTLPPVRGTFVVWVTDEAPDYSRRYMVTGAKPPPIMPQKIEITGKDKTQEIVFREAASVTVRGTVRRTDGSPAADVYIEASMLPPGWAASAELGSARTDSEGHYALRIPAPVPGVQVSVGRAIRAPDGTYGQATAVGHGANANDQFRSMKFDPLTRDVEGADWVVKSAP